MTSDFLRWRVVKKAHACNGVAVVNLGFSVDKKSNLLGFVSAALLLLQHPW